MYSHEPNLKYLQYLNKKMSLKYLSIAPKYGLLLKPWEIFFPFIFRVTLWQCKSHGILAYIIYTWKRNAMH